MNSTALPELKQAIIKPSTSNSASVWFDECVEFVRHWSPQSYPGYANGVALWVLSTVAARRVMLNFSEKRYTNLMIILAGRTTITAKSSAARVGLQIIKDCDLDWLLMSNPTPEKFIKNMSLHIPDGYDEVTDSLSGEKLKNKIAHHGARGWFYDEFGGMVSNVARSDSPKNRFREIFRQLDDPNISISNDTIGRGNDCIESPYLALLGSMTPADVAPLLTRSQGLWNDGFFPRLAFITPHIDDISKGRYPAGERVIPVTIKKPLLDWHKMLGTPKVTIEEVCDEEGEPTGKKIPHVEDMSPQECCLGKGVVDAFYTYHDELLDMCLDERVDETMYGSYGRFSEKALRAAMLLASLENEGHIEMKHWAKSQEIAEGWRKDLHEFRKQTEEKQEIVSSGYLVENKIPRTIERFKDKKGKLPTKREIGLYANLETKVRDKGIAALVADGVLREIPQGKTTIYDVVGA
jgi:uncharacterized protein DUF3987